MRQNLILSNPAKRVVTLPKETIKFSGQVYNYEKMQKVLSYFSGDPIETPVILSTFYGLRRSEALGLKWDAIDFELGTLTIRHKVVKVNNDDGFIAEDGTKNAKSYRTFPLINEVANYLKQLKHRQEVLAHVIRPQDIAFVVHADVVAAVIVIRLHARQRLLPVL
jgi:integrase